MPKSLLALRLAGIALVVTAAAGLADYALIFAARHEWGSAAAFVILAGLTLLQWRNVP